MICCSIEKVDGRGNDNSATLPRAPTNAYMPNWHNMTCTNMLHMRWTHTQQAQPAAGSGCSNRQAPCSAARLASTFTQPHKQNHKNITPECHVLQAVTVVAAAATVATGPASSAIAPAAQQLDHPGLLQVAAVLIAAAVAGLTVAAVL